MTTTFYLPRVRVLVIGALLVATLAVTMPAVASAATYAYVNTSGSLSYVAASSPDEAFLRATNRNPNSGVMLVSGTISTPTQVVPLSGYVYVNTAGKVVQISATSATEAFAKANDIAPHSGVMPVDSVADAAVVGDHVLGS